MIWRLLADDQDPIMTSFQILDLMKAIGKLALHLEYMCRISGNQQLATYKEHKQICQPTRSIFYFLVYVLG